jgi:L-ascorbate metabolism protein UlaG (beta-lactamase superfamily)
MRPGDQTRVGPVTVTTTLARHGSFRPPLGPNGESVGYIAEGSRRRAYFAGDTDLFAEMGQLGDLDVALVPVWGWGPTLGRGHLDPARAADALTLLRPRLALPIHWGTLWPRGLDRVRSSRLRMPPREFASRAADVAPGVEVARVPPGAREPVRL